MNMQRSKLKRGAINPIAAVAVLVVLVAGGTIYRRGLAALNRADIAQAFERDSLKTMTNSLGQWTGTDKKFEEWVVKVADVDDYLLREFTNEQTGERVTLYIAAGARARDLFPHRPEICYPSNGMTMSSLDRVTVPAADGDFEARLFQFRPGGMNGHPIAVLNYFVVDGLKSADEGPIRERARTGQSSVRYLAQVQITQTQRQAVEFSETKSTLIDFAGLFSETVSDTLETNCILPDPSKPKTETTEPAATPEQA